MSKPRRATLTMSLVAIAAIAVSAAAEAPWEQLPPSDTTRWLIPNPNLHDVTARDGHAWAVGYWGAVLVSADAGQTWTRASTPTDHSLFAVSFADASHGWAVGAYGVILRTSDGGTTWEAQSAELFDGFETRPLDTHLFGVSAVGPQEAWAVGDFGAVLHTTDGRSWSQVRIPEETYIDDNLPDRIFNDVHFLDPQRGWIAGEFGTVLRTSDGGATWSAESRLLEEAADLYLYSISALDPNALLVSGLAGRVLESDDAGANLRSVPADTSAGIFAVAGRGTRALAVGDRGVMFARTGPGAEWTQPKAPPQFNWLTGAVWAADDVALVVGENGIILRSADGGRSFTRVALPTKAP